MFNETKYSRAYFSLVESRKKSKTVSDYHERHHIIPGSLGGSNDDSNLVYLTAKEHFIAHLLLVKMCEGDHKRKMSFAIHRMSNNPASKGRLTAAQYEMARRINREALKNRKLSDEHKARIGDAHRGVPKSEEQKRKMSEHAKTRTGSKNAFYGLKHSDEMKAAISKKNKDSKWYNNGSETICFRPDEIVPSGWVPGRLSGGFNSVPKKKCPYCEREMVPANIKRHVAKCSANLAANSPVGAD